MWKHLRTVTGEPVQNPNRPRVPTDPPRENSHRNSRSRTPDDDDATANPRPRNRHRASEPPATPDRCCDCNVWGTCSAARNANCACRRANRECQDCRARHCKNCPSEHGVSSEPGAGRSNTPTPAPHAIRRAVTPGNRRFPGSTNPPTTRPPTPNPSQENADTRQPPGDAPVGEEDPPPADPPAGEPQNNATDDGDGVGATPTEQNNTPIAEGGGGGGDPPNPVDQVIEEDDSNDNSTVGASERGTRRRSLVEGR